ncbi:MAG: hypothetical protein QXU18_03260 [Thermoplasmatales archaeon]
MISVGTKRIIVNGANHLVILPKVWLENAGNPGVVHLEIDERKRLILAPMEGE